MPRRTPALRPVLATLAALTSALLLATLLAPSGSAARPARPASLSVSPANGSFTAGQQLTFRGTLGRPGRRTVRLQSNLGRSGDTWRDVPRATARTSASGAFTLRTPAAAMLGVIYRVASGSRRTPSWTSQVVHQDVAVTATSDLGWGQALVGQPVTVTADTARMPLLSGRRLTLEQRSGTRWTPLAAASVGADGRGSFVVTPTAVGTVVYRVRMEDWDVGVGHVGWFPSYPVYVDVLASATADRTAPGTRASRLRATMTETSARAAKPHQTTAAGSLKWGTQLVHFDWEHGESLTDRSTGTRRRGWWLDGADGSGRVALRNGSLQLSSNSEGAGRAGSSGSTWATLRGTAQAYGRWETRLMPMTSGGGATPYRVRAELVPASPAAERCGAQTITLLDLAADRSEVVIGARSLSGDQWTRTVPGVTTLNAFHAFAVEVTKRKITWFVDGRVVGRITDRAAISGQPLTVRLSMQADGAANMRTTRTLVDWVRTYPATTGRTGRGGVRLTRGTHTATC